MTTNRLQMLAREIKKKLAIIFNQKIEDNRLKNIVINDVLLDKSLGYAKIYFLCGHVLNTHHQIERQIYLLNRANMFIRKHLFKMIVIKTLPAFIYLYDKSIYQAEKILNLIKEIKCDGLKK